MFIKSMIIGIFVSFSVVSSGAFAAENLEQALSQLNKQTRALKTSDSALPDMTVLKGFAQALAETPEPTASMRDIGWRVSRFCEETLVAFDSTMKTENEIRKELAQTIVLVSQSISVLSTAPASGQLDTVISHLESLRGKMQELLKEKPNAVEREKRCQKRRKSASEARANHERKNSTTWLWLGALKKGFIVCLVASSLAFIVARAFSTLADGRDIRKEAHESWLRTLPKELDQIMVRSLPVRDLARVCDLGARVPSDSVFSPVSGSDEDYLEKLKTLLTTNCIDGYEDSIGRSVADSFVTMIKSERLRQNASAILKTLVDEPWFDEKAQKRLGFTSLDIALIKNDEAKVESALEALDSQLNPADKAALFRFAAIEESLTDKMQKHANYLGKLSYRIDDPSRDTLVVLSGPGGTAWSYSEMKYMIQTAERLGLNWVMLGDGVSSIDLDTLKSIKTELSVLKGRITVVISGHGNVDEGPLHVINLADKSWYMDETPEVLADLSTILSQKPMDVFLNSCHSGAAMPSGLNSLPEGSRLFTDVVASHTARGTLDALFKGVDYLRKPNQSATSAFDLFLLGYLMKRPSEESLPAGPVGFSTGGAPVVHHLREYSIGIDHLIKHEKQVCQFLKGFLSDEDLVMVEHLITRAKFERSTLAANDKEEALYRVIKYAIFNHQYSSADH
jgi:hypothetical protein